MLQRVPDAAVIAEARISAAPGNRIDVETLKAYFAENGFNRTGTVVDPGDYAIRGGIIDLYAPGAARPSASTSSAIRSNRSGPSIPKASARSVSSSISTLCRPARFC